MRIEDHATGRQMALAMAGRFPERDWVAALADRSGKPRDFVEWHLQEDMEPPAELVAAANAMLDEAEPDSREEPDQASDGLLDRDDLPFSGLPGNLGKLRKE